MAAAPTSSSSSPKFVWRLDRRENLDKTGLSGLTEAEKVGNWNDSWAKTVIPTSNTKDANDFYLMELARSRRHRGERVAYHRYKIDISGLKRFDTYKIIPSVEDAIILAGDPKTKAEREQKDKILKKHTKIHKQTLTNITKAVKPDEPERLHLIIDTFRNAPVIHGNKEVTVLERIDPSRIQFVSTHVIDNQFVSKKPLSDFLRQTRADRQRTVDREVINSKAEALTPEQYQTDMKLIEKPKVYKSKNILETQEYPHILER